MEKINSKFFNSIELETGQKIPYNMALWPADENGNPISKQNCKWNGSSVVALTNTELLAKYKILKFKQLKEYFRDEWPDSTQTVQSIKDKMVEIKAEASGLNTKQKVDNAYDAAIIWFNS